MIKSDWPEEVAAVSMMRRSWPLLLGLVVLILVVYWVRSISENPIDGDGAQGVQAAVNLAHFGTVSRDREGTRHPTMYREPVPVFLSAAIIKLMDAASGVGDESSYFSGARAWWLKSQNILWFGLICVGAYVAAKRFTGSSALALLAVLLLNVDVPLMATGVAGFGIDTLNTELPAAAFLILASYLAATAGHRVAGRIAVAGLLFGALVLVKASFLYVSAGVLAVMLLRGVISAIRSKQGQQLLQAMVMALCMAIVIVPWMLRNYAHFGTFSVAERGGVILMIRAYKDLMSDDEYAGAFYVWSPAKLQPLVSRLTGFGPEDLRQGGRLQRLNRTSASEFAEADWAAERAGQPERAIAYYRKARAERRKLVLELGSGSTDSRAADEVLQRKALGIIRDHPGRHLALTVPFLWRGAAFTFPIFLAVLVYATMRRRDELGLFVLPAFGWVMFYALLSHFIPRYAAPVTPVAMVAVVLFLGAAVRRLGAAAARPT